MNENLINDHDVCVFLLEQSKKIPKSQLGIPGWTEEEKDRMRRAGYDGMDMIRAWYS